jgi:F-type H+-transporting ATPase subunit b
MTLDVWGLGLQAVNVLILVWLLSRVFWRPVAGAIARRQETAQAMIETAQATQAQADAALEEARRARDGIAAEHAAMLARARKDAEAAARTTRAEARAEAETLLSAARTRIDRDIAAARTSNARQAADLSLVIAAKLLAHMNGPVVQSAFLAQLVEAIAAMPAADRATLIDDRNGIQIVTAKDPGAARDTIEAAVREALGGTPDLRFVTDPDLIAGLELRSPHFVLRNSWQADLRQIRKAVSDAA